MGQAIVVITRGIDLSIGGVIDLANAIAALYLGNSLSSMVGCSLLVLLVGAACGLFNGLLVAYGRVQPILVTLATLAIFQGAGDPSDALRLEVRCPRVHGDVRKYRARGRSSTSPS